MNEVSFGGDESFRFNPKNQPPKNPYELYQDVDRAVENVMPKKSQGSNEVIDIDADDPEIKAFVAGIEKHIDGKGQYKEFADALKPTHNEVNAEIIQLNAMRNSPNKQKKTGTNG